MRTVSLALGLLALAATACSAIVSAQLKETDGYKKDGGSLAFSSNGTTADECALIELPDASNACSECIARDCEQDLTYACQRGSTTGKKQWFSDLANCAENPYLYGSDKPEGSGASFYACGKYADAGPSIDSDDDAAKKRASEICVQNNCMQGPTPACKQCYIETTKGDTSDRAALTDDPCGKCVASACAAALVKCCDTQPMGYVRACAYTADPANKAKCKELGGSPDAGAQARYNDEDNECLVALSQCFKESCANKTECQ